METLEEIEGEEIESDLGLLNLLGGFVNELRDAGLPVSLTENLDAIEAVTHIPIQDRKVFKAALSAALVKSHTHERTFDTAFEVYFSLRGKQWAVDEWGSEQISGSSMSEQELSDELLKALVEGDQSKIRELARMAVQQFANMSPGRPVGGTYYLYRTLKGINMDSMLEGLLQEVHDNSPEELTDLEERLIKDEAQTQLDKLRQEIESEIRRRLVADRGAEAVAKTVRQALPEDIDFMHASKQEMEALRQTISPLARKLAARLSQKRRHGNRGPLDFRSTIRHSLSFGGVLAEPKFKFPKPYKPEIVVLADISGSVAAFARFTLHLVYSLNAYFTKIRSFVFIDGVDEVTQYFEAADEIGEAIHRVNTEADVVWVDGHSDYGHAFESFWDKYKKVITPKTSLLVLGDARNNYHAPASWVLKEAQHVARKVYWLNPEPKAYWNTGDSIIEDYQPHLDGLFEVRNLRQLTKFVETL